MSVRIDLVERSTVLDPVEPMLNRDDAPSLEDLAWVDSCFVGGTAILSDEWDPLKNDLQGIGASHGIQFPASRRDDLASPDLVRTDNDSVSSDDCEGEKEVGGDDMVIEKIKKSKLKKAEGVYPFRPNYNEHLKECEDSDFGLDLGFPDLTADPLPEEIFKVWDLDIPADVEDGHVAKQLLAESSLEELPSSSSASEAWKDLKEGSLDGVIAGISDLSLGSKY